MNFECVANFTRRSLFKSQNKSDKKTTENDDTAIVVRKKSQKSDSEFFQCDHGCKICSEYHIHKKRNNKTLENYIADKLL